MRRKYLDDLGIVDRHDTWNKDDNRQSRWSEERAVYGFDERETWGLDHSFYCWLYERLMMFLERNNINLDVHRFDYNNECLTQQQCIDRMLSGCKIALTTDYFKMTEDQLQQVDDVAKIWAIVLPAMWW